MRRPWNLVNTPVYSLATASGDAANMNICTYVTPISRRPKCYAVSLEPGSKSCALFSAQGRGVLQLLTTRQASLIRVLGYRSGHVFDKYTYLESRGLLAKWEGRPVLRDAAAYLALQVEDQVEAGDHRLFICQVERSRSQSDRHILMLQDLIQQGLILS
ncbi:MAG: flavin reductase family protein [Saprospiraceae bacterium]|nr:flavin reductase family protein [Saprospiraceae bacterium]